MSDSRHPDQTSRLRPLGYALRTPVECSAGSDNVCHPERRVAKRRAVEGRNFNFALAFLTFLALLLSAGLGIARADTVVYTYPALPGPVANCQWFDDNLNDRSIDALIRQTDLIYNRAALPADANVTVTQSAKNAAGTQLVGFDLNRRSLCADSAAFYEEAAPLTSPASP